MKISKKELLEDYVPEVEKTKKIICDLHEEARQVVDIDKDFENSDSFHKITGNFFLVETLLYKILQMYVAIGISVASYFEDEAICIALVANMKKIRVSYLLYATIFNNASTRIVEHVGGGDTLLCIRDIENVCDRFSDLCDFMIEMIKTECSS